METVHKLSAAQLDQLYRLAWLVLGDERRAVRRLQKSGVRSQKSEVSRILAGLAPQRTLRYRLKVPATTLARSGLTPSEFAALARALRTATPQSRLELGAPHLVGEAIEAQGQGDKGAGGRAADAGRRTPDAAGGAHATADDSSWPRRAVTGTELFLLLARAWGDVPAETPYALALNHAQALFGGASESEAQALRAALLADGAAGDLARAVRSGLRRTDDRLAAALPALFSGEAPAELHALRDPTLETTPERRAANRAARLQFILAGAVLALVLAVILAPEPTPSATLVPERNGLLAAEATLAPAELVQTALDRFERGDVGADALHERYRMVIAGETRTLERWYDPGEPARVRVEVRDGNDQLLFAIASDGETQLQSRWQPTGDTTPRLFGIDYTLDAAVLEHALPIVRRQPDGMHFFSWQPLLNLEYFYLAQAYVAEVQDLGATTVLGRPARLIGFASRLPFPPAAGVVAAPAEDAPAEQVILAIDTATYALLEVRVLPQSEAAGSVVTPWQADLFTTRSDLMADDFTLAPVEYQRLMGARTFISPRLSWLPEEALSSLGRAIATTPLPLVFPPPDSTSLGYVLQSGSESILVRESEHEIFMVAVFPVESVPQLNGRQEERQMGDLRYRMIYPNEPLGGPAASLAAVPLANGAELQMYYQHAYATQPEREARVAELLSALEPLTRESVETLAADFIP